MESTWSSLVSNCCLRALISLSNSPIALCFLSNSSVKITSPVGPLADISSILSFIFSISACKFSTSFEWFVLIIVNLFLNNCVSFSIPVLDSCGFEPCSSTCASNCIMVSFSFLIFSLFSPNSFLRLATNSKFSLN